MLLCPNPHFHCALIWYQSSSLMPRLAASSPHLRRTTSSPCRVIASPHRRLAASSPHRNLSHRVIALPCYRHTMLLLGRLNGTLSPRTTRLNKEFFDHLSLELGQLRFATSKTKDMEDRLIELEALQKVLIEGTEACDSMEKDLLKSRQRLTKILQSKDRKATLLDMVENNELNRSLLMLLDENIASAYKSNQEEAATFMENIRKEMLKYMTK